jgi:hypothetical protein
LTSPADTDLTKASPLERLASFVIRHKGLTWHH